MPTYEISERVLREFRTLSLDDQRRFLRALREFVAALREDPPAFAPRLRVKRVQGHPGVWELSFAPDGRATFCYDEERERGEAHVIWRRIGDHSVFADP